MTTKHSPPHVLKAQADQIAATLKAVERGDMIDALKTNSLFAKKAEAARSRASFKFAVVMDDKVIVIEMPWTTIRDTDEAAISADIVKQMREKTP